MVSWLVRSDNLMLMETNPWAVAYSNILADPIQLFELFNHMCDGINDVIFHDAPLSFIWIRCDLHVDQAGSKAEQACYQVYIRHRDYIHKSQ